MTTLESPAPKKSFQLTLPIAIVIASVVIAGAILLTRGGGTAAAEQGQGAISVRPPSSTDHIIGSPDAPVVIIEYSDFECPYCSLIYPTIKKLVDSSGGKVAWVYRNLPLESIHPEARPAAEAAECIAAERGNDAFWKFANAVFSKGGQQQLAASYYPKIAAELGADPQTFSQCMTNKAYDARINDDVTEAVQNGAQGTPFTVVYGKDGTKVPFSGALPENQVNAIVQSVLSKQK